MPRLLSALPPALRTPATTTRLRVALGALALVQLLACGNHDGSGAYSFVGGARGNGDDGLGRSAPPGSCVPMQLSRGSAALDAAIAMDGSNLPLVSWTENGSSQAQVYLRAFDGAAWQGLGRSEQGDGLSLSGGSDSAVAVDGAGSVVVAWTVWNQVSATVSSYGTMARRFSGSRWLGIDGAGIYPGVISADVVQPGSMTMVVAPGNAAPVVAFDAHSAATGTQDTFALGDIPGIAWGSMTSPARVPVVAGGSQPAMVLQPSGTLLLATLAGGQVGLTQIAAATTATSGTVVSAVPGRAGRQALSLSLAVDGSGTPWLAYEDNAGGRADIFVASLVGGAWVGPSGTAGGDNVSQAVGGAHRPTLVVDPKGLPRVAWEESPNAGGSANVIKVRLWDGSHWTPAATAGGEAGLGKQAGTASGARLAVGTDGNLAMAWQTETGVVACTFAPSGS